MSSIEFSFTDPLWLLLAIPAFAIILLPFFRLPAQRRSTFRRIVPVVLHLLTVSLLVLIISGFTVVKRSSEKAVMLVVDLSESTRTVRQDIDLHADRLLQLVEEETPVGVVVFGQDQLYTVRFYADRTYSTAKVDSEATDISGALQYAASLLPGDRAGHMILLSDGKQTDTDANDTAAQLASRGIRLDAVYFDTTGLDTKEVQLTALKAPDGAYVGDTMTFTADVSSNTEADITLSLYDGAKLLTRLEQTVAPGSTLIELPCEAVSAGVHSYQLVLDAREDTLEQNNACYAYVNIAGQSSVLIIADTLSNAKTLAAVLEGESSVTTASVWDAPKTILELCSYDEVILSNVDYALLPQGYDALLESYVSVYGRSLLVAGGEKTLMYGGMFNTALEEMLPVSLTLEEDDNADSVALMLVLDCSTSMIQRSTYMTVAKQGAIKCVQAMSGNDYVGIVSFSSIAQVQSPLIRATENNKESLTRLISGLTTYRGTSYREAVELAHQALLDSNAKTRHIIFLSDGQPYDQGYMEAVKDAAADGITVSTIGLGFVSSTLQSMALHGNGRYYSVTDATQLPNIMLSETKQVTVDSLITGSFTPVIARQGKLTESLETASLPTLQGYLGTTLKDGATAYLVTEKRHPIYAQWTYGKGTVGCFTSDLNGNWSSQWLADPTGAAMTRNMVCATVDLLHKGSSMTAELTPMGQSTQITVTTADTQSNTLSLSAQLAGNTATYVLTETEPGIYTGSIDTRKAGVYELLITQTDGQGALVDYTSAVLAVSYPKEYDAFYEGGEALLQTLCSYTGGQLYTDMEQLAGLPVGAVRSYFSPMLLFAVLCMLLLLADIAIRKLRWKDVRNYFLSHKLPSNFIK